MKTSFSPLRVGAAAPVLALSLFAVASSFVLAPRTVMTSSTATPCAYGTRISSGPEGEAEREGRPMAVPGCQPLRKPEGVGEMMALEKNFLAQRGEIDSATMLKLYQQRAALASPTAQAAVPGSGGTWKPYGIGPLHSEDSRFPRVNGLGLNELNGRVDSLDYDSVNKRLFATVGTGGVWMSTDLAQSWISVGDKLPSQIIGAAAWTPAGGKAADGTAGGTLLALGGEPSMGGDNFNGLGAFWSDDLGASWHLATGVPANIMGLRLRVDAGAPSIVYAGTSKGLYRSTDAGRNYTRIVLPVGGGCETKLIDECQFAHFVTEVVVKVPGGSTTILPNPLGSEVIAAVGYRAGMRAYPDGKLHSPGNGLYKSATGAGTWTEVTGAYAASASSPVGFTPKNRIGRVAMSPASGATQNHNYLYAIVQDAVLFNGGVESLDVPDPVVGQIGTATAATPSSFGGLYASADFGATWIRMADTTEISNNPSSGTQLTATSAPGQQGYYNLWIAVDPTLQLTGIPTRLLFGLEEIWATRLSNVPLNGTAQSGNNDFKVVADYFAGNSCAGLSAGAPACPTSNSPVAHSTAHPDQHVGMFVADASGGGVTLVAGNDGGVFTQHVASGADFVNNGWGIGNNKGFHSLLPYGIGVAKDHTVWFGLQDNGSGKIFSEALTTADKGRQVMAYGGDGFFAATDPDNSNVGYSEYTYGDMRVTTDGGTTWTGISPGYTASTAQFANVFKMDPSDANHLVTAGNTVQERTTGPTGSWVTTFTAGTNPKNSTPQPWFMSTLDVKGANVYVGYCGVCDILNKASLGFYNALATNVGGPNPPVKGGTAGWHFAAKNGLPNRWIGAIEIDPIDPKTVYVGLGDYANRQWASGKYYQDTNNKGNGRLFKSIDAGQNFTDITGNLPDAPITAIQLYLVKDKDGNVLNSQLIAGGDLGMFISSDTAGSNWVVLGQGLPVTPVRSMQVSPADPNLLFVAEYGRGVYTYAFADPIVITPPTNKIPVAHLTADKTTGTAPVTVMFDGSTSTDPDAGDAVVSYTFDYGDGANPAVDVATPKVAHDYSKAGRYVATLTVKDKNGGVSVPSTVEIILQAAQTALDHFTFIQRDNVPINSFVTSEEKTITGSFSGTLNIRITGGGQYSINGAAFTNSPGTIRLNDTLRVRHVSANKENTATVSTVTVDAYSTDFKSVTTIYDRVPDAFDFGRQDGREPGVQVESKLTTPTAYDSDTSIVAGPNVEYRVNGVGAYTRANGTLTPGQSLQLRTTTNTASLGYTKTYVKVGGVTGYFTTRTKQLSK